MESTHENLRKTLFSLSDKALQPDHPSLPQVYAHPYHTTATLQPFYHRRGCRPPFGAERKNVTVFTRLFFVLKKKNKKSQLPPLPSQSLWMRLNSRGSSCSAPLYETPLITYLFFIDTRPFTPSFLTQPSFCDL